MTSHCFPTLTPDLRGIRGILTSTTLLTSLLTVLFLLQPACTSPSGGNGLASAAVAVGTAGQTDAPCVPLTQFQGCNGRNRMLCEQPTKSWQMLAACAADERCVEKANPSFPGSFLATCAQNPMAAADVGSGGAADGVIADGTITSGDTANASAVCARWNADHADLTEGDWDGSAASCKVGKLGQNAIDNTTRLVNLYRYLTNLPQVVNESVRNQKAQACALIMRANNRISHTPAKTWKCWNADGAEAAKKANLSTAGTVRSVDRYMVDSGANNAVTLGHRRWILNRKLDKIGVGSAGSKYSCMWIIGGKRNAKVPWTAWPNAGKIPYEAINPYGVSTDKTGWSIQSDTVNFAQAKISVSVGGVDQPVVQRLLKANYGSKYAIAFNPKGWSSRAGVTYLVSVNGIAKPFSYSVEVLDCGVKTGG